MSDFPSVHPEPNDDGHVEAMLNRFFEGSLTDSEAVGLLEILDRHPQIEKLLRNQFYTEQVFRFSNDLKRPMPLELLDRFRSSAFLQLDEAETLHEDFEFSSLIHLGKESPSAMASTSTSAFSRRERSTYKPLSQRELKFCVFLFTLLLFIGVVAIYQELRPCFIPETPMEPPLPTGFARITGVSDIRFPENGVSFKRDQGVDEESICLEAGLLELRLKNNVRIVLEGPAEFRLTSLMDAYCKQGRLSVYVPPNASGYEVFTPQMTIRDVGTEFVLDVRENKTELHVVQGLVKAKRLAEDWMSFPTGRGVRLLSRGDPVQIAADKSLYQTESLVKKQTERYEKERREHWDREHDRWKNDPSILFYWNESAPGARTIGCRKTSGRWRWNEAVSMTAIADRIEWNTPATLDSFTLVASLKIDRLNSACNTVFASEGNFAWQIDFQGRLQLLLGTNADTEAMQAYDSPPILSDYQLGTWFEIATVVDARQRRVTHYVDGRPVASLPLKSPLPMAVEKTTLGNLILSRKSSVRQQLNGSIDAFYLFQRVLEPGEIPPAPY